MIKAWKKIGISLIIIISMFQLAGCTPSGDISEVINPDLDYELVVPYAEGVDDAQIFFSLPIEQLYQKASAIKFENGASREYVAGETAELVGENVEQLDGMTIGFIQKPLTEVVIDEEGFCCEVVEAYNKKYNQEAPVERKNKQVLKLVEQYNLLTTIITFDGTITKDVTINNIIIDELGYNFQFENFSINMKKMNLDANVKNENGNCIEYDSSGGIFCDSFIGQAGYCYLEGKALKTIKDIQIESLSDDCIVINADNYDKLLEKYSFVSDITNKPDYTTSIEKGGKIQEEYNYIFAENPNNKDGVVASLLFRMKDSEGNSYWKTIYIPSTRSGEFLLISELE